MGKAVLTSSFLLIFCCFATSADIYKYVDEKGVIHLSNKPTGNGESTRILAEKKQDFKITPSRQRIVDLIDKISLEQGLDPALVRAVARAESAFNPQAKSHKGAIGVMQLMPDTATRFNVRDIRDPHQNITGGIRYLKYLLRLFRDNIPHAVAAYNAGEQRVIAAGGIPDIQETKSYVSQVIRFYNEYHDKGIGRPVKRVVDEKGHIHLTNLL